MFTSRKVNSVQKNKADIHNQKGYDLHAKGKPAEAIDAFNTAIDLNPQDAGYYNNRGLSLFALGEFDKAISDFNTAILLDSKKAAYFIGRGLAWFANSEFEKAIADYTMALNISPKNTQAYSCRGIAYLMYAQDQNGQADIERALRFNQDCILSLIGKALLARCQDKDIKQALYYENRIEDQLHEQRIVNIACQFRYYFYALSLQYVGETVAAEKYYRYAIKLGPYKAAQLALDDLCKDQAIGLSNAEKAASEMSVFTKSISEGLNIDDSIRPSSSSQSPYPPMQTSEIKLEIPIATVKIQAKNECSFEEFIDTVKQGKLEQLKVLNFSNDYLSLKDQNGFNALHHAALNGHLAIVQSILLKNADINAQDLHQNTALHLAAISGKADIIALLHSFGADQKLKNDKGDVPLHLAAFHNHLDAVEMLLKIRSEINAENNNNETPLHYAAQPSHQKVVDLLLQNGADLTRINKQGKTPTQLSLDKGYSAIVNHITTFYLNQCAALKASARKQDDLMLENNRLTSIIAQQKVENLKLSSALSRAKQFVQPRESGEESRAYRRRLSI